MRNGEKLRSFGVPTLLLTLAPAPSDCSIARNDFAILRGASVVKASSGMTGSPRNMVVMSWVVLYKGLVVFARDVTCLSDCVSLESMYSLL